VRDLLEDLRNVADPAERARQASTLIDDLRAARDEASLIRKTALETLRARGMTQTEIAQATGMTRGRLSQVIAPKTAAWRPFLAPDAEHPVTVALAEKRETERGQPAIAKTTMTAFGQIRELAAAAGTSASYEAVPPPGIIDLNRPNLVALIGPRISALVAQVITSDPAVRWERDGLGNWYVIDVKTGTEYHSDYDGGWSTGQRGNRRCFAHMGRIRRPDGQGSFLYLGGTHAPGTAGAVEMLTRDIAALWEQAHRSLWSAISQTVMSEDGTIVSVEFVTPVYIHGKR
jgi:hypothetical protein